MFLVGVANMELKKKGGVLIYCIKSYINKRLTIPLLSPNCLFPAGFFFFSKDKHESVLRI